MLNYLKILLYLIKFFLVLFISAKLSLSFADELRIDKVKINGAQRLSNSYILNFFLSSTHGDAFIHHHERVCSSRNVNVYLHWTVVHVYFILVLVHDVFRLKKKKIAFVNSH